MLLYYWNAPISLQGRNHESRNHKTIKYWAAHVFRKRHGHSNRGRALGGHWWWWRYHVFYWLYISSCYDCAASQKRGRNRLRIQVQSFRHRKDRLVEKDIPWAFRRWVRTTTALHRFLLPRRPHLPLLLLPLHMLLLLLLQAKGHRGPGDRSQIQPQTVIQGRLIRLQSQKKHAIGKYRVHVRPVIQK